MRIVVLLGLALSGGCHHIYGYSARDGAAADQLSDRSVSDLVLDRAPADTARPDREAGEASTGDLGPAAPPCPSDPALVACYRFEPGALGMDGSGKSNHLTVTNVTSVPGVEGQAAKLTAASRLVAAHDPSLNPTTMTMEVWVRPTIPGAARAGVLDKNLAYGIFILSTGQVYCDIAEGSLTATISPEVWSHVACSFDGATLRLYLDGNLAVSFPNSGSVGTGSSPLVVGGDSPTEDERLEGEVDSLRIWSTVRTAAQICAAAQAGGKSCQP